MKQRVRQLTALILALAMCLSLLSANVWASEIEPLEDGSVSAQSIEEVAVEEDSDPEASSTEENAEPENPVISESSGDDEQIAQIDFYPTLEEKEDTIAIEDEPDEEQSKAVIKHDSTNKHKELLQVQSDSGHSSVFLDACSIIDSDSYQNNMGDSFVDVIGCNENTRGNTDINGNSYQHGVEVWLARWNYEAEKSWAYATFALNGEYDTLTGDCVIIESYNTDNFDTTIYFYGDNTLIKSYRLTPSNLPSEITITTKGIKQLKIYAEDNKAVEGGTSIGLVNMILNSEGSESSEIKENGKCGSSALWSYNKTTGTLTISGTGNMYNYDYNKITELPWYNYRNTITNVIINNGITSIGNYAFYYCERLRSVAIPNSVTRIGDFSFQSCYSLNKITIPNNVTVIGDTAFGWCSSLVEIIIPSSVTKIGAHLLRCCSSLTSISIPDSVTQIGDYMFFGCRNLTNITIPSSVNSIGYVAFSGCESLHSIYFKGNAPLISADVFYDVTATAYYPAGNKTWTTTKRKNYGGKITWKEWTPSINDTDLTPYQKKVLDMVNRTQNKTTLPMHEFHDPNDMILDYLSTSDLSKMVVTETGSHLSSHSMWKEAYYRALDKMTGIDQFVSLLSDADDLFGDYSFIKETLSDSDLGLTSTVITAITSVSKDQIRKYYIDMFALEEIYENTTDKDLQSACRDRMEKRQYELKKAFKKILQDVLSDYDRVTSPALESISSLLAKNSSKKVAVALKSLGYAAEAASYVSAVITVKDIIVKVNGWSDLTESYQNSIADTYICNALRDSYQKQLILYNKSSTPGKLDHLGLTFEHIKLYTQDNYDQMKTILGKKYKSVVKSDDYLKQRINLVEALSIDTYKSTNVQYMKPKLNVSGYLYMEVGGMVAFSVLNTRYGAQIELQSKDLISSKVLSLDKGCIITAKNVGRAKVTVRVKQNGGQYYPMSFEVIVRPKAPGITKVANKKKNSAVVKWKKVRSIAGYNIQYSTSSTFKTGVKTQTVKKPGTTSITVKNLKRGKTYYFRIRSYKTIKNNTYSSAWSSEKKIKINK